MYLLPASDGREILFGLVRTGPGRTAKAEVRLSTDRSGRIAFGGRCSCGSEGCRHAAALAWAALGSEQVGEEEANPAPAGRGWEPIREEERERARRLDSWLDSVAKACAKEDEKATGAEAARVLYLLSLLPSGYGKREDRLLLHVHPVAARLNRRGEIGRTRTLAPNSGDSQAGLLSKDDRLILAMIQNATFGGHLGIGFHSPSPLRPAPAVEVLERTLATGRSHWEGKATPPLRSGDPIQARIEWALDDEGGQRPRVVVDGPRVTVLPVEPLWYVDPSAFTCGPLQLDLPARILGALGTAPRILPDDVERVRNELRSRLPGKEFPLPATLTVEAAEESPAPIPVLRLSGVRTSFRGWTSRTGPDGLVEPRADLVFRYGDLPVRAFEPGRVVQRVAAGVLRRVRRDPVFERRCVKRLEELDITACPEASDLGPDEAAADGFDLGMEVDDLDAYLMGLSLDVVPALRAEGWEVEVDESFPYRVLGGHETWYADVRPQEKTDWFDLELGVEVEGERISLLPVLLGLLRDPSWTLTPDQIAALPDDGCIAVPLPDGRLLPLSTGRARTILGTLVELHASENLGSRGVLRLSSWNSSRLAELEQGFGKQGLTWSGGEALRAVGAKLRDFRGIESCAPPEGFEGELRGYQRHGLDWLQFLREHGLSGILADDMGLGKTVQVLAHLLVEKRGGRMDRPSLVIAPTSLMPNWRREAQRFAPDLRVLVLQGLGRKQHFERLLEHDVVLTTYPLLPRDEGVLTAQEFHLLILDEAQFLKNSKARASAVARRLKARHRLALTGTPMENHLGELRSIFDLLMPGLLGDERGFRKLFRTPIEKHGSLARRDQLTARIRPFLLRRTKNEVAAELPPKTETVQVVELQKAQRDLYESIRLAMHEKVKKEVAAKGVARSTIIILDALLKLRQVCCDPGLLKIKEAQRVHESAKRTAVMEMLTEMVQEGRRVLLFSQFTSMIELLEADLRRQGIEYVKLTGDTRDREKPVKRFQGGEVPLFLISLKAGGTGLNLPAADTVIHYDPWWNPAVEDQATDRAHRIGQDKPVFVYKLIAAGTVEEKILALQARKRDLARGIYGEEARLGAQLSPEDLEALFRPIG